MNEARITVDTANEATIKIRLIPQEINGRVSIPVRVQGLQGEPGQNSVYVGTTAPTEDFYEVWVNPIGIPMRYVSSINDKTGEVYLDPDDYGVESLTNQEIEEMLKF